MVGTALNSIDYAVIIAYAVILLAMGLYLQKQASKSIEHYFLAGRNLPWWALGVSGMTNFLDMAGTMIITSYLFMLGPRGLFIELRGGACLVLAFAMCWTGKWHFRSRCMTGAEWQIFRFGSDTFAQLARIIAAVAMIVLNVGMIAYLIKGAGLFLSMFFPYSPMACAMSMVGLTVLYTVLSGFYGVVYNDLFQSGVILIGVAIVIAMAAGKLMGFEGDFGALAAAVSGNSQWMSSMPHVQTEMPPGYEEYRPLLQVSFFYLMRNFITGPGWGDDPRYFGARNERECGLLTFLWTWLMTFRWPMMIGFAVLGIFLIHEQYPNQAVLTQAADAIKRHRPGITKDQWETRVFEIMSAPQAGPLLTTELEAVLGPDWKNKLQMVSFNGTVNPERILPAVILNVIPPGLRGLFLASLLAAAMSTLSPQINSTTAFFTRDIYQAYLRRGAANRELIGVSYVFGVALVAAGFIAAYSTESINDIWDWIIMGLLSGIGIPRLLRLYWWRFNASGVFFGTLVGLVAAVGQRYLESVMKYDWAHLTPQQNFTYITLISIAGAVIGTYLTPPTDRGVLENFYLKTRPFGLWGPLKHLLSERQQAAMHREHFYDIVALPFALIWQITLFLIPMQMMIGAWTSVAATLPIWGVGLVGVLWFWYRNLPPAEPPAELVSVEAEPETPMVAASAR